MWLLGNGVQLISRFLSLTNGEQQVHFRSPGSFPVLSETCHGTQVTLVYLGSTWLSLDSAHNFITGLCLRELNPTFKSCQLHSVALAWPALLFSFRFRVLDKFRDSNPHLLSAFSGCSAAVWCGADCTDPSQLLAKAGEGHFASGGHGHGASPSEPHWVSPIQKGQQT